MKTGLHLFLLHPVHLQQIYITKVQMPYKMVWLSLELVNSEHDVVAKNRGV